jgi:hypothetical protein
MSVALEEFQTVYWKQIERKYKKDGVRKEAVHFVNDTASTFCSKMRTLSAGF